MAEARAHRETVKEAAAAWVVRLSDPASTDADRRSFERWRAESHDHEVAYEREAAAWERLDRLRALRPADPEPDPDLLAPDQTREPAGRAPIQRWAAGLVGAVAIGASVIWSLNAAPAYATGIGERRVVVLEDGTRIELNTNSRIVVHYRRGERVIKLVRGEALFDVVADPARPFVVAAKDKRVTAGASSFNVRLKDDALQVLVAEGAVDVADRDGGAAETHLAAGAVGLYSDEGGVNRTVPPQTIEKTLAWRHGQIALDGQTLETAVAEFNRYSNRRLVIADPAIAGYRLGGYFRVDDMEGFVRAVESAFPVTSEASDRTIYLSAG